jgi:CubicO group peptidase (beta-lactamase class C family)
MSAEVDRVLRDAVAQGDVPMVVGMAADEGGVIYEGAAGPRRVDGAGGVTPDDVFRIASMTKMVTTVAALQLVDHGTVDLDAPVDSYCPEFGTVAVLDGFDGDTPRLRPPSRRATVRDLMTHTSGLAYWFWSPEIIRWEETTGTPNVLSGSNAIFNAPMVVDPGTRFQYGINTDWLGRVVEAASGLALDKYFAENILEPLGMTKTTFQPTDQERAQAVPVHGRDDGGNWVVTDVDLAVDPQYWAGGHGLFSTPRDYLAFQRMLLGGGALGDVRLLRPSTVDAAFANQIGDLDFPPALAPADPSVICDFNVGPGFKFGLGLLLNTEPAPGARAAGTGAWAGIFNTHFWVDRTSGLTGAIYTQTLPFADPRPFGVYANFEGALYASR